MLDSSCLAPSSQRTSVPPSGSRPRADLNRDRWIQGPECWPLHHETNWSIFPAGLSRHSRQGCATPPVSGQHGHVGARAGVAFRELTIPPRGQLDSCRRRVTSKNGGPEGCGPPLKGAELRCRQRGRLAWTTTCATQQVSRGFEPRSLDSESRVLTVTPRGQCLAPQNKPPNAGDWAIFKFNEIIFGIFARASRKKVSGAFQGVCGARLCNIGPFRLDPALQIRPRSQHCCPTELRV